MLTDEEAAAMLQGINGVHSRPHRDGWYVGNIAAVPRLGLPSINMQDAAAGFRTTENEQVGQTTSWPSLIALAATWDPRLAYSYAAALGREFRRKGANVVLGPSVNVHRVAVGGRNAEYLSGEDGLLGAVLGAAYVRGVQSEGVAAVVKHFVGNSQELHRGTENSIIDARTLHEVYYPPFAAAVEAGVASVMCAYNLVNGVYACRNSRTLKDELRREMGFTGWVTSDWWAIHDTDFATGGADQEMPFAGHFALANLYSDQIDFRSMAKRVLQAMFRVGALEPPSCNAGSECIHDLYEVDATSGEHTILARSIAAASAVLLKNANGALPLASTADVMLLGSACDARQGAAPRGDNWALLDYFTEGGSGRVFSAASRSLLQGLADEGMRIVGHSPSDNVDEAMRIAYGDGTNGHIIPDVVIACGGATSQEGFDRDTLALDQHNFLVELARRHAALPAPKPRLVVAAMAPGAFLAPWAADVDAAVVIFLAGQAHGGAWADVLLGDVNPSGKLPVTLPNRDSDVLQPCTSLRCEYSEGLWVGWRSKINEPVAFPFGHGLSYSSFTYSWANASALPSLVRRPAVADGSVPRATLLELAVIVTNSGNVAGCEVAQLYLQYPPSALEPLHVLRAFAKTPLLAPGQRHEVRFRLVGRDLSTWVAASSGGSWQLAAGEFSLLVGASSRDFRLERRFVLVP